MQAEYLILNDSSERQIIKQICEHLPNIGVSVLAETLVIEPVDLSDLSRLVVPTQNSQSILEAHLEYKKVQQKRKEKKNNQSPSHSYLTTFSANNKVTVSTL